MKQKQFSTWPKVAKDYVPETHYKHFCYTIGVRVLPKGKECDICKLRKTGESQW